VNRAPTAPDVDGPRTARSHSGHLRGAADLAMVGLARVLIRVFFRRVEVEHGERIRSGRPTVLVANHRNGLVDGLLLIAALGRYPRFLGKSTLFRIPVLWPFLKLAGVVPVYRAQDGGRTTRNSGTFARSHRLLAQGGLVAIFPEGISHDLPGLQPLRTGAARIALGAAHDGVDHVETVAVALLYDEKQRFRSRALVRVGEPEAIDRWSRDYRMDDRGAVHMLTQDLAIRLRQVGPDRSSWAEADTLAAIGEIVARDRSVLPHEVGLGDGLRVAEALGRAEGSPEGYPAMESLRVAHGVYRHDLALLGLSDAQVAPSYRPGRLRWLFLWALAKVVVAAPLAAVGVVVHVVPYELVRQLSRLPANEGVRSTVKLLGCFFLFSAVYVWLGVVVGEAKGALLGLVAAVGAPACGYVAVRLAERVRRIGGALEGVRFVRNRGHLLASVLADRAAVVAAAGAVLVDGPEGGA
jgi:glycerol-3-phosphate O-acyltransferase / dihydroxyacetone phosphate acyltransferase